VNENSGNSGNDFFYDLLDNPADLSHSNAFNLQLLINEFPQSSLLRAMLAVKREEESLNSASAYINPKLLYKIANTVSSLRAVSDEQIAVCQAPGEAKPMLPLPNGLELPNLTIEESNYFHVPIDRDVVYIEDENAEDIALPEEDQSDENADQQVENDEVAAVVIGQNAENDIEIAEESEVKEDAVPSSENDTEVAEDNEAEDDAVPSSENDVDATLENEAEEDAAPSSENDTEVAEESETQDDAAPSSENDTEVAEESEAKEDAVPSSENDVEATVENEADEDAVTYPENSTEVAEEGETQEGADPLLENGTEVPNENEQEAQTDATPVETEAADANQAVVDKEVAQVSENEVEGMAEADEQLAVLAETVTEAITDTEGIQHPETGEAGNVEEELISEHAFVQPDTESTLAIGDHEHIALVEQADNLVDKTEDSKVGIKPTQSHQEIDDEVFEEIVSIEDIGLEQLALMDKGTVTSEAEQNVTDDLQETAAGDSYFVFEPTLPEDEEYHAPANIATQNAPGSKDRQHVSRYNDEKMPYSFMWWLDKTRKEHASIYQPFAAEGKFHTETVTPTERPQPAADNLQQQYVENIFAVSAVVSDLNVIPQKVDAPAMETKADKIIEKFIHEEPQIKHPSKVKLDSENKAKKSSEDRDELVTETLAKIYTEQMLYHKAILTYKKLMLKFPEKSLYFAGQIEQLENKIN
jgi:hypothetical protein